MQTYTVRDVERVLRLPCSTLRGLIDAGFVTPTRGKRREYRFSFHDLIVLRAARALIDAKVPRRRIKRALKALRRHLPQTVPLLESSICAVGDRMVVRDGRHHWQVDDGQYVLGFDVSVEGGTLRVIERKEESPLQPQEDADWFARCWSSKPPMPRRPVLLTSAHSQTMPRTFRRGSTSAACCTSVASSMKPSAFIVAGSSTVGAMRSYSIIPARY
jgi:DNA-binding transcriptional MerR regulator